MVGFRNLGEEQAFRNQYSAGRDLSEYLEPARFSSVRQGVTLGRREGYASPGENGSGSYRFGYIPRPERRSYAASGSGTGNVLAGAPSKTLRV